MNAEKQIANILAILVAVAGFGASAQLSISFPKDFAVAPITGQSLTILVAAHLLGWKRAGISVLLYLILGSIGLPVFSGFSSGLAILTGTSGGYFIGFLIAAMVVGFMAESRKHHFFNYIFELFVGSFIILLCGGLGLLRFLPVEEIFSKGIVPFLPGAIVKITIGAAILAVVKKVSDLFKEFSAK